MARRDKLGFTAIRTEGGLLPPSILSRIHRLDPTLDGLNPEDYGLSGTKIREAASQAWNALQGPWRAFQAERTQLAENEAATGMTRRKWLDQVLKALDYGSVDLAPTLRAGDRTFAISHLYKATPMHLIGCGLDLEKRTKGAAGAAAASPHGIVQLFLNADDNALWGFLSNGLRWRVLRDSVSLSRLSYVEFDLEAILEGQLYDEFLLFWLVCHQTRVKADRPDECWLEKWHQAAGEEGKRALNTLRSGVEKAIEALGQGFLRHPENKALRERIRAGELDKQDYYRQLLRMVYRLLFLFVAEDRGLLLHPNADESAKRLFTENYGTQRIRLLAERLRGSRRYHDLFVQLKLILKLLGKPEGCPELGLPALGGFLFSEDSCPDLDSAELSNADLLEAIRFLAVTQEGGRRSRVDYKNLASEEMGSVYESLLELHPDLRSDGSEFKLGNASGNERKTTGSYYTPDSLIQCLLDTALEPVVADALKRAGADQKTREAAILDLKVIDPAVGSGHFLIATAHRLAKRLAQVRSGEDEPSPEVTRHALRDVIGRCLYGIDLNPMAAELCKVALWMEALEPGKPLSFLDHHIVVGNSLLGTTPELIAKGIPDGAYDAIEGDDKEVCKLLKKQNKQERDVKQGDLFDPHAFAGKDMLSAWQEIESIPDEDLEAIRKKEKTFRQAEAELAMRKLIADTWCAAFTLPKTPPVPGANARGTGVTTATIRRLLNGHSMPEEEMSAVQAEAQRFGFLHPHLTFPGVYAKGGFDAVVGNPPYLFLSGKGSPSARLRRECKFQDAEKFDRMVAFASNLYPEASQGCRDLFKWFIAISLRLVKCEGRVALVVPSSWISLPRFADIRKLVTALGVFEIVELGFAAFPELTVSTSYFVCGEGAHAPTYANVSEELHQNTSSGSWRQFVEQNSVDLAVSINGFSVYRHYLGSVFYGSDEFTTLGQLSTILEGDHKVLTRDGTGDSWPVVADWELVRHKPVRIVEVCQSPSYTADSNIHTGHRAIIRKTGDSILASRIESASLGITHQNAYLLKSSAAWLSVEGLVALLNSRMATFLYRAGTLGQKGRTMAQLRVVGLRELPMPHEDVLRKHATELASLGRQLEWSHSLEVVGRLNSLVYSLYSVSDENRVIIDEYCDDVDAL